MTPADFLSTIVDPCLARVMGWTGLAPSPQATVLVMAIAGQEGSWKHRRQVGIGQYNPQRIGARSYWQGELTGGMILAVHHPASSAWAAKILEALEIGEPSLNGWVMPTDATIFEALAWNNDLGCSLARLLLWTDPRPLPALGQRDEAWDYYQRNWRPGAPHPEAWPNNYGAALALVSK